MSIEELQKKLKENGYKITSQRKAILEVLIDYQDHFISAEKLFNKVKIKNSKVNLSTIYRNLDILNSLDFVHKITINDDYSLFSLVSLDEHHHHIICKCCGKTEVIPFCPFDDLKAFAEEKGFDLTQHKIELYGYCKDCKHKNKL
ncbi:Fur family transcriptional regulator [Caldisalinibacter kiritimatiensis]|uniref:Ferric-uptake regulator n=1 Tax=Caldisalinibacter kiritimatiensis TaxID=1304284 RepID=R1CY53_9FIRM|nr:Fur family transcriptional regulator [Caldisalinibacter kiritimatiensis]EOD01499.1 Ferric-uptake regulator [Caldisalinibacter kiritimatiensis]